MFVVAAGLGCAPSDAPVGQAVAADSAPDSALAGSADAGLGDTASPDAADGLGADCGIVSYELTFALDERRVTAKIGLESGCKGVVLQAQGLAVEAVTAAVPVAQRATNGRLEVAWVGENTAVEVVATYKEVFGFNGLSKKGSTVLWPDFCGNLYPCHAEMADGATYTLAVTGVPAGQVPVFAATIAQDAPAYMPALAVGAYTWVALGVTKAGTKVGYWTLPSTKDAAKSGTTGLVAVFDWLETTLGPYSFGDTVGPVAVDWGLQIGGLENHPFWHVSTLAFGDLHVNAHEAAHGWFGCGIRLACWEDLVLSEGVSDYLAARALGAIEGKDREEAVFAGYAAYVANKVKAGQDKIVWPKGCGAVDVDTELLHQLLYKKGAMFFKEVGDAVGRAKLDGVLGAFYQAHHNKIGRLAELIAQIDADTGFDPSPLVAKWLRTAR